MSAAAPGRSRPRWSGGASPRPGDASATSCANGACGRVRAQTVRTAQDAGRRGQAREHPRPRVRRLRAARRVRHQRIVAAQGQSLRQRRGRIHQQAPEEGAHMPEPPHRPGTTTLRPQRLCVVVRRPKTPLHPRIPEPQRIHTTRTRPLKNCPTRRCQSTWWATPKTSGATPRRGKPHRRGTATEVKIIQAVLQNTI